MKVEGIAEFGSWLGQEDVAEIKKEEESHLQNAQGRAIRISSN